MCLLFWKSLFTITDRRKQNRKKQATDNFRCLSLGRLCWVYLCSSCPSSDCFYTIILVVLLNLLSVAFFYTTFHIIMYDAILFSLSDQYLLLISACLCSKLNSLWIFELPAFLCTNLLDVFINVIFVHIITIMCILCLLLYRYLSVLSW